MRPAVKLPDDLVVRQASSHDCTDYLVWSHAGYSKVSRAPQTMLRPVRASNCVIDLLAPESRVNHYGLAANGLFDLFQQLRQALQVANFLLGRAVVKLSMVGNGQFFECEMWA